MKNLEQTKRGPTQARGKVAILTTWASSSILRAMRGDGMKKKTTDGWDFFQRLIKEEFKKDPDERNWGLLMTANPDPLHKNPLKNPTPVKWYLYPLSLEKTVKEEIKGSPEDKERGFMEFLRLYERGMTAKAGNRKGGLSDKRKLLIVEKIKEAYDKSKEKTRSGTWQYLRKTLPKYTGTEGPGVYYEMDEFGSGRGWLVQVDEDDKEERPKRVSFSTFRLKRYWPKKLDH